MGIMLAGSVTEAGIVLLISRAGERGTCSATVRVLSARNTDIRHASWAIRGAHAAANVMEVLSANRVPEGAPFLAVVALVGGAATTSIRLWFVAVSAVIAELFRAVLPADGTDTIVVIAALGIAERAILLLVSGAGGNGFTNTTAIGKKPA